jgi:hypothetical protein
MMTIFYERQISMNNITMLIDSEHCASTTGATFERLNHLEADDDLIRGADFSLTSVRPIKSLVKSLTADTGLFSIVFVFTTQLSRTASGA